MKSFLFMMLGTLSLVPLSFVLFVGLKNRLTHEIFFVVCVLLWLLAFGFAVYGGVGSVHRLKRGRVRLNIHPSTVYAGQSVRFSLNVSDKAMVGTSVNFRLTEIDRHGTEWRIYEGDTTILNETNTADICFEIPVDAWSNNLELNWLLTATLDRARYAPIRKRLYVVANATEWQPSLNIRRLSESVVSPLICNDETMYLRPNGQNSSLCWVTHGEPFAAAIIFSLGAILVWALLKNSVPITIGSFVCALLVSFLSSTLLICGLLLFGTKQIVNIRGDGVTIDTFFICMRTTHVHYEKSDFVALKAYISTQVKHSFSSGYRAVYSLGAQTKRGFIALGSPHSSNSIDDIRFEHEALAVAKALERDDLWFDPTPITVRPWMTDEHTGHTTVFENSSARLKLIFFILFGALLLGWYVRS